MSDPFLTDDGLTQEQRDLALLFHKHSDHAKDGIPLGGHLCNCTDTCARVEMLINRVTYLESEAGWTPQDSANAHLVEEVVRLNSLVRKMRDENSALKHEHTLAVRRFNRTLRKVSAIAEKALKK